MGDRFDEFAERLMLDAAALRLTHDSRRQMLANALRDAHARGAEEERARVIAEVVAVLEVERDSRLALSRDLYNLFGEDGGPDLHRGQGIDQAIAAVKALEKGGG
jgi:hypothetical protein